MLPAAHHGVDGALLRHRLRAARRLLPARPRWGVKPSPRITFFEVTQDAGTYDACSAAWSAQLQVYACCSCWCW